MVEQQLRSVRVVVGSRPGCSPRGVTQTKSAPSNKQTNKEQNKETTTQSKKETKEQRNQPTNQTSKQAPTTYTHKHKYNLVHIWEVPKIRGTLFGGPYNKGNSHIYIYIHTHPQHQHQMHTNDNMSADHHPLVSLHPLLSQCQDSGWLDSGLSFQGAGRGCCSRRCTQLQCKEAGSQFARLPFAVDVHCFRG